MYSVFVYSGVCAVSLWCVCSVVYTACLCLSAVHTCMCAWCACLLLCVVCVCGVFVVCVCVLNHGFSEDEPTSR